MTNRGILVLGTDTAVGKTVVSVLLITELRRRGVDVAAFKPVETGCNPDPLDALAIRAAAGREQDPLDLVCPYRFSLPAAPEAAALAENQEVDVGRLRSCFDELASGGRFVVAEASGGAGTPYGRGTLGLDLARILDVPVLLVARAVLGTVGLTLLAVNATHHARASTAGIVLCRVPGYQPGPEDPTNVPLIESHSGIVPVLGTLPVLDVPAPSPRSPRDLRAWAESCIDVFNESVDITRLVDGPEPPGPGR
jgi:dethiobiotin synthetase